MIPFSSRKIWKILNVSNDPTWQDAGSLNLEDGHHLNAPEILFTKIEDDVINTEIERLQNALQPADSKNSAEPEQNLINTETFSQVELRVAQILEAEPVKKSDRLLKLQVDLGEEKRQIIAGIAQNYKPETLIGKKVIVVVNKVDKPNADQNRVRQQLAEIGLVPDDWDGDSANTMTPRSS